MRILILYTRRWICLMRLMSVVVPPSWLGAALFFLNFLFFVGAVVGKVAVLQGSLQDLENPQVELHLHNCLSVCKVNLADTKLTIFCAQSLLSPFFHSSNLLMATFVRLCLILLTLLYLTLSLVGLDLHDASGVSPAAFLGCCVSSQGLCTRL